MNTLLPFPSFIQSAMALDYRRLGKQRREVLTTLRSCLGLTDAYQNHPCTLMWKGSETALVVFGMQCCNEWKRRGYVDNTLEELRRLAIDYTGFDLTKRWLPQWWGGPVHDMYKGKLLRKDLDYYGERFPEWHEHLLTRFVWPTP